MTTLSYFCYWWNTFNFFYVYLTRFHTCDFQEMPQNLVNKENGLIWWLCWSSWLFMHWMCGFVESSKEFDHLRIKQYRILKVFLLKLRVEFLLYRFYVEILHIFTFNFRDGIFWCMNWRGSQCIFCASLHWCRENGSI